MPEAPFTPPPRKPVSTFPTPSPAVAFYTELVNRTDPAYVNNAPVRRGTRYSTIVGAKQDVITQYPDLFFLGERKFQLNDQLVFWDWATDEEANDTYNSEATYVANSVAFPAFTRVYTIRRELYESEPTLPIGSALTGLVSVTITNPGQDYTFATGTISGTDCAVEFVVSGSGELLIGVVTNEGSGVTMGETITITGDGSGATAVAVVQSTFCVLTAQKKEELAPDDPLKNEMVRVTRVYETLPGPWITTTRWDKDGALITSQTRRNIADSVQDSDVISNAIWTQTTHKGVDEFVAEETAESRSCPGNVVTSTKVEEDGKILTTTRQLVETSAVTSSETLAAGVWTKKFGTEVDDSSLIKVHQASNLVSWQVIETRPIPGNVMTSEKLDNAGNVIYIFRELMALADITPSETVTVGHIWIKVYAEAVSDLVAWQVQEQVQLPGNVETSTKLNEAGDPIFVFKRLQEILLITTSETVTIGGIWIKTNIEPLGDLVGYETVEQLQLPGNIITATDFDRDGVRKTISKGLVKFSTVVTSEVLTPNLLTRHFGEAVSDLVSQQVTEIITVDSDSLLDLPALTSSIPNSIPEEFRPFIVTTIESHIIEGAAAQPALALGEFEHSERQLSPLYKEVRSTTIGNISLPITHYFEETTEQYGGGVVHRTITLETLGTGTIDEGQFVVSSTLKDLGNGMEIKNTAELFSQPWPSLVGTNVDERYGISVGITKQVVAAGTTGGLSGSNYIEVRSIDKWRSISIASKLDVGTLPGDTTWFSGQRHSFPPELTDAVIDWAEGFCGCSDSFSAVLIANMTQYTGTVKTRVTEQFYNGVPPDNVTVTQFFPQEHNFGFAWSSACGDSDGNCRTKSGAPKFHIPLCLHGNLTLTIGPFITFSFPATNPSVLPHSTYIMLAPHVERWRLGIFRRVLTEVLVPA